MRRTTLTCLGLASLALASCSSNQSGVPEGPAGETAAPITGGTADTANPHTAVVALLAPISGGYSECSGTIVQVSGGIASVLTAAHCCNQGAPTIVVMSNDYSGSVSYISSSSPPAPAYAVIASSVQWDQNYNGNATAPIDDFCMLQFNAPTGTTTIPVATGSDSLAVGTLVDYVGFGVTSDTNQNNTIRNIASNVPINTAVTANTFSYTESSKKGNGGPCEGDSGGPALVPPGVPQSQQTVVGTTSYGSNTCSATGSTGVDMRVLSQTGPGGFISTYLGGGSSSSSSTSSSSSSGGGGAPTTCTQADGFEGCCDGNTVYYCAQGAAGSSAPTAEACPSGYVCGWKTATTGSYYGCVKNGTGSADPSGTYPIACPGSSTSSSTSSGTASTGTGTASTGTGTASTSSSSTTSSSGGACAGQMATGDPTCDACIDASCCSVLTACLADQTCVTCASSASPASTCSSDAPFVAWEGCLGGTCASPCGNGTGGSSTTGSGTASTGSGTASTGTTGAGGAGTTSTGSGTASTGTTGAGGATGGSSSTFSTGNGGGSSGTFSSGAGAGTTGTGTGTGAGVGHNPGSISGCSVAGNVGNTDSSDPTAPASFAGLLFGAALIVSRRRR